MDKPKENEPQNKIISIECLPNEIFHIIFEELDDENIWRTAMVCRRWMKISNNVKKLRPFCFATFSATRIITFASIAHRFPINPSVGFFFLRASPRSIDADNATNAICELLPPNCLTIIIFTLASSLNKNFYYTLRPSPYMCALLPQHPKVQLRTVQLSNVPDHSLEIPEKTYTEYTQMIETASRQYRESFMCLMLFCDISPSYLKSRLAKIAKTTFDQNRRVSFCGGVVTRLRTNNNKTDPLKCVALLITGSIKTWSIVLEIETRCLAQEKLQKFKEQIKLWKHAVGFVFFPIHLKPDEEDGELTIFRDLFPNVPLIGCCCSKVFGRDTAIYEAQYLGPNSSQWYKENTITFMILTYN